MNLHWLIHTMLKIFLSGLIPKMNRALSDLWFCSLHQCDLCLVFNVPWLELCDRQDLDTGIQDCLENFENWQRWSYSQLGILYIAFFSYRSWASNLENKLSTLELNEEQERKVKKLTPEINMDPDTSGSNIVVVLLLSGSLSSHHCFFQGLCFLCCVNSAWFWPLVLFWPAIPSTPNITHSRLLISSRILAPPLPWLHLHF